LVKSYPPKSGLRSAKSSSLPRRAREKRSVDAHLASQLEHQIVRDIFALDIRMVAPPKLGQVVNVAANGYPEIVFALVETQLLCAKQRTQQRPKEARRAIRTFVFQA
jgi:hypothetical protein